MQKIENGVKSLEGVNKESVKVLFNSSKVRAEFDDEKVSIKDIENSIDKLGYEVCLSVTLLSTRLTQRPAKR